MTDWSVIVAKKIRRIHKIRGQLNATDGRPPSYESSKNNGRRRVYRARLLALERLENDVVERFSKGINDDLKKSKRNTGKKG